MRALSTVLTFFALWISTQLNFEAQNFLAFSLILTFGVLHGSNDLTILSRLKKGRQKTFGMLVTYVTCILAVVAVFFFSKLGALLFFILISSYHFGEQHLNTNISGPSWLQSLTFILYGQVILFLIFALNLLEVIPIFKEITGIEFSAAFFEFTLYGSIMALVLIVSYQTFKGQMKINILNELFLFAVFAVVFKTATLVWGFCIYFIVWHSAPSIKDQLIFLYGKASKATWLSYLKSSWPYWTLSIVGLFVIYMYFGNQTNYFITLILYLLAAITFPHVLVMSKINGAKNLPEN